MRIEFGEFTLDGERQELLRRGERIAVTPKVMQLLELLLERRGRLVSHAELHDTLWPDVVVSEANVKNLVSALRRALDDHQREGRFLRSVHGRGYIFTGDVREAQESEPAVAAYIALAGGRLQLRHGANLVGREEDCAVRLDDATVSRHHAKITVDGDAITLDDLGSKNGTYVDGERITGRLRLEDEHDIAFGGVLTRFSRRPGSLSTLTFSPLERKE